jgi:hypothetical protein
MWTAVSLQALHELLGVATTAVFCVPVDLVVVWVVAVPTSSFFGVLSS